MFADLVLFTIAFYVMLTFDMTGLKYNLQGAVINSAILYIFTVIFQLAFQTNKTLWRYAGGREYIGYCLAGFLGCISTIIINMAISEMPLSPMFIIVLSIIAHSESIALRLTYKVYKATCEDDKTGASLFGIKISLIMMMLLFIILQ